MEHIHTNNNALSSILSKAKKKRENFIDNAVAKTNALSKLEDKQYGLHSLSTEPSPKDSYIDPSTQLSYGTAAQHLARKNSLFFFTSGFIWFLYFVYQPQFEIICFKFFLPVSCSVFFITFYSGVRSSTT